MLLMLLPLTALVICFFLPVTVIALEDELAVAVDALEQRLPELLMEGKYGVGPIPFLVWISDGTGTGVPLAEPGSVGVLNVGQAEGTTGAD